MSFEEIPTEDLEKAEVDEELNSIYSELDQSMAQKKQQLIFQKGRCDVCLQDKKDSCLVLSEQCGHQACIDCIQSKITEPIQRSLEDREKISIDMVSCKAEEWCQHIIHVDVLLPLLNL